MWSSGRAAAGEKRRLQMERRFSGDMPLPVSDTTKVRVTSSDGGVWPSLV